MTQSWRRSLLSKLAVVSSADILKKWDKFQPFRTLFCFDVSDFTLHGRAREGLRTRKEGSHPEEVTELMRYVWRSWEAHLLGVFSTANIVKPPACALRVFVRCRFWSRIEAAGRTSLPFASLRWEEFDQTRPLKATSQASKPSRHPILKANHKPWKPTQQSHKRHSSEEISEPRDGP